MQNSIVTASNYKHRMINFDDITNENKIKYNLNWLDIPEQPYRIYIIGGSRSRKTSALLSLTSHQPDIEKM